jgi:predicted membrane protein
MEHQSIEVSKLIFYGFPAITSIILTAIFMYMECQKTNHEPAGDDAIVFVAALIPLINILWVLFLVIYLMVNLFKFAKFKKRGYRKDQKGTYHFTFKHSKISVSQTEIYKKSIE